ncbi:hypothetical protein, partial [Burkholderia sp. LMG 13014]|uniref:hypothetical protein n=1 Tax=Burkholderia sp. LMG 13014 TaxID=2709306 RepID=UPI001964E997
QRRDERMTAHGAVRPESGLAKGSALCTPASCRPVNRMRHLRADYRSRSISFGCNQNLDYLEL